MKICFIGNISISFQKNDFDILNKYYDVDLIQPPKKKIEWLKYPFIVAKKIKNSDISFSWFAGWHSFFPVFFSKKINKKSIVVVGGYDIENMPEISYGAFTNLKEKIAAKYVLKNSNLLLPFSDYAINNLKKLNIETDYIKIYLCCDSEKFIIKGKKEDIVITVSGVKKNNLKRKGLENFINIAKFLPNVKFILIGKFIDKSIKYLKSIATDNVEFTDFIDEKKLIGFYQKSKVYCQLSYQEGFGLSLAEAMLCESIPVVTKRGSIPELVGNAGYYVPYGNENAAADAIKKAINSDSSVGEKARERIIQRFNIKNREKKLINNINNIAGDKK